MKLVFLNGSNTHLSVKVDDEDYERVKDYRWYLCGKYAVTNVKNPETQKRHPLLMHRLIMGLERGNPLQVDHINQDGLDCRRSNMRVCTLAENQRNRGVQKNNTSGYKGVYWNKQNKKYFARIRKNGIQYHLGSFDCPKEAYRAYCEKATELHGEFFHG